MWRYIIHIGSEALHVPFQRTNQYKGLVFQVLASTVKIQLKKWSTLCSIPNDKKQLPFYHAIILINKIGRATCICQHKVLTYLVTNIENTSESLYWQLCTCGVVAIMCWQTMYSCTHHITEQCEDTCNLLTRMNSWHKIHNNLCTISYTTTI